MRVGLMLSTFDWPGGRETFADSLGRVVGEADRAGVEHVWLMDHLRQIPQLGAAWHDLPDPFTTLAWIAARTERVRLGVLVTPAFLRPPALLAKAIATLDVVSGGRAMCGLGVGWFAAEYAAAGIAFPGLAARYDALEDALGALPAFWGKGAPAFAGRALAAGEALSYPRPLQEHVPIWVGGGGERRTLALTARLADGANLQGPADVVARKVDVLRRHCRDAGRDPAALDRLAPLHGARRARPGRGGRPRRAPATAPVERRAVCRRGHTPARSTTTPPTPPASPPPASTR